jgi:hypothetical protein
VPWFRKRWFIVLMMLSFTPVAAVLAATGPLYFDNKGKLSVLPKDARVLIYILTGTWVWNLIVGFRGSSALVALLGWVIGACVIGFKSWKQDGEKPVDQ